MADGPLRVPPEEAGATIARIFDRGGHVVKIERDPNDGSYMAMVDGIGYSDPDDFATALWYIDAGHAIARADHSWARFDDPPLPSNPKYPRKDP